MVVTGRVTDAALVDRAGHLAVRLAAATTCDALAGSVVAGHIIECGCQATGGNYAFFSEVPDLAHCGFPIAELHADGSSVITKHPGTGGLVSVGTVTAQLLYEIAVAPLRRPRRGGALRHDPRWTSDGPDRVRVSRRRAASRRPARSRSRVNYLGGYRNTMTLS